MSTTQHQRNCGVRDPNPCLPQSSCVIPFILPPTTGDNLCTRFHLPNNYSGDECSSGTVSCVTVKSWDFLMHDLPGGTPNDPYCSDIHRTCTNNCDDETPAEECPTPKCGPLPYPPKKSDCPNPPVA